LRFEKFHRRRAARIDRVFRADAGPATRQRLDDVLLTLEFAITSTVQEEV
jgi:hypothetical protein